MRYKKLNPTVLVYQGHMDGRRRITLRNRTVVHADYDETRLLYSSEREFDNFIAVTHVCCNSMFDDSGQFDANSISLYDVHDDFLTAPMIY